MTAYVAALGGPKFTKILFDLITRLDPADFADRKAWCTAHGTTMPEAEMVDRIIVLSWGGRPLGEVPTEWLSVPEVSVNLWIAPAVPDTAEELIP